MNLNVFSKSDIASMKIGSYCKETATQCQLRATQICDANTSSLPLLDIALQEI